MSKLSHIARTIAAPAVAIAVVAAGFISAADPAEAKISRRTRDALIVGAVVGTAVVAGAAVARSRSACWRETNCFFNRRGDEICRTYTVCD